MPRKAAMKASRKPKGITPLHKVRIEDELWDEGVRLTKLAGTNNSQIMRDALERWIRRNRHKYEGEPATPPDGT